MKVCEICGTKNNLISEGDGYGGYTMYCKSCLERRNAIPEPDYDEPDYDEPEWDEPEWDDD